MQTDAVYTCNWMHSGAFGMYNTHGRRRKRKRSSINIVIDLRLRVGFERAGINIFIPARLPWTIDGEPYCFYYWAHEYIILVSPHLFDSSVRRARPEMVSYINECLFSSSPGSSSHQPLRHLRLIDDELSERNKLKIDR